MGSFLAWLDYSEGRRRQMLDVIDAFRLKDSRDELGLGGIRDALAELLFPGTSTIQTRARYFLFIPWIYQSLLQKRVEGSEIVLSARKAEVALIKALVDSGEKDGVIGIEKRERLKRLPSNVYWLGLETWGIRRLHASQTDFHRIWKRIVAADDAERNDDGERLIGSLTSPWHAKLPSPPTGFPSKATLALTREEAQFLRDQVLTIHPRTLLAFLLDRAKPWKPIAFPWQHPAAADAPAHAREVLAQARVFSEVMHGAAILYNLMLAEKTRMDGKEGDSEKDLTADYREMLREWSTAKDRAPIPAGWPDERFWDLARLTNPNISPRARAFVLEWTKHTQNVRAGAVPDGPAARKLVSDRELAVKGQKKARLHDASALALWNGAAGLGQMDFRWGRTQRISLDIIEGIARA